MKTRRNPERGQAVILYTMTLGVMVGMLGLVVDVGWMYYREQAAQAAAESAALAAVIAARQSSPAGINCGVNSIACQSTPTPCPNPIPSPPTNNLHNGCLYAQDNGFAVTTGGKQNVTIQANNTLHPPTVSNMNAAYWVTVRIFEAVPQTFSAVLGHGTGGISARATAAILPGGGGGCVYVLAPGGVSLTNNGNAYLHTGCGAYVNSNDPGAITLNGNANLQATNGSQINVRGGYSLSGGAWIMPAPVTQAPVAEDPFATVSPPPVGTCVNNGITLGSNDSATISPGTYCGVISLGGQSSLTLNPGVYVLQGGLSMQGQTSLYATGVTLYVKSGSVAIQGGANVNLSAPTSGPWEGFAIFQDRANTNTVALNGGATQNLSGVIYAAGAPLQLSGNGLIESQALTLVSRTLTLAGNAYIHSAVATLYTGNLGGVALIE